MDCPQCEGGTLVTYTLDEREAHVCDRCGYVGIPADHHGERDAPESWNDALRRYHEEHPAIGTDTAEVPIRRSAPDRDVEGPRTWEEVLDEYGGSASDDRTDDGATAPDDPDPEPDPDATPDGREPAVRPSTGDGDRVATGVDGPDVGDATNGEPTASEDDSGDATPADDPGDDGGADASEADADRGDGDTGEER
jgi:hypothetical protein